MSFDVPDWNSCSFGYTVSKQNPFSVSYDLIGNSLKRSAKLQKRKFYELVRSARRRAVSAGSSKGRTIENYLKGTKDNVDGVEASLSLDNSQGDTGQRKKRRNDKLKADVSHASNTAGKQKQSLVKEETITNTKAKKHKKKIELKLQNADGAFTAQRTKSKFSEGENNDSEKRMNDEDFKKETAGDVEKTKRYKAKKLKHHLKTEHPKAETKDYGAAKKFKSSSKKKHINKGSAALVSPDMNYLMPSATVISLEKRKKSSKGKVIENTELLDVSKTKCKHVEENNTFSQYNQADGAMPSVTGSKMTQRKKVTGPSCEGSHGDTSEMANKHPSSPTLHVSLATSEKKKRKKRKSRDLELEEIEDTFTDDDENRKLRKEVEEFMGTLNFGEFTKLEKLNSTAVYNFEDSGESLSYSSDNGKIVPSVGSCESQSYSLLSKKDVSSYHSTKAKTPQKQSAHSYREKLEGKKKFRPVAIKKQPSKAEDSISVKPKKLKTNVLNKASIKATDSISQSPKKFGLDIFHEQSAMARDSTAQGHKKLNANILRKIFDKTRSLDSGSEAEDQPEGKKNTTEALKNRMEMQLITAKFRCLNEQLYKNESSAAVKIFDQDPKAFQTYLAGYEAQVAKWPVDPLNLIIDWLSRKPVKWVIADLGCGKARLAESVPQKKVYCIDVIPLSPRVIACDMAHTPIPSNSVQVVIFCLSLMGTNLKDFIIEANRIMRRGGILKIAEVESRFDDLHDFIQKMSVYGFHCIQQDTERKFFWLFDFRKIQQIKKNQELPTITLKPCLYRNR